MGRNANCKNCGLYKQVKTVCLWGHGDKSSNIVVIGEAPGETEDNIGKPFVGRSGQLLSGELKRVDIRNAYITNVVKCRPPKNRPPTPAEVKACKPYIEEELREINPKYVLALGAVASKAILKVTKITEAHGQIVPKDGFIGMAAYHPAFLLRDPSKTPAFQEDLRRFSDAIQGKTKKEPPFKWIRVTHENLQEFVDAFRAAPEFAFDTETSGLFPFDPLGFIRCISVSLPDTSWVIPFNISGSDFDLQDQDRIVMILTSIANLTKKRCVAHNGKFDNLWLWLRYKKKFNLTFDTMLAHHVLDENSPHDLKYLARRYLNAQEYDISKRMKEFKSAVRIGDFFKYAAKDSYYTLKLYHIFKVMIMGDFALRRLFYQLVMHSARAVEQMESQGLYVDTKKMVKVEAETKEKTATTLKKLNMTAKARINWNSPRQVGRILFKKMKLPVIEKTPTGAPSTSEPALIQLKESHPIVPLLQEYRSLEKFRGTYLEGWKEYMVRDMLYLSYKIHGTVGGRFSSRLHQVPRDGTIRNLITAPPGWTHVVADYSQAELRIVGMLSNDPELITCYRRGVDVHWRTLINTIRSGIGDYTHYVHETVKNYCEHKEIRYKKHDFKFAIETLSEMGPDVAKDIWPKWKEARTAAKSQNFAFVFGMHAPHFVEYAKIEYGIDFTLEEGEALRRAYFQLYRGIEPWHQKQRKLVRTDGFVRSLTGRLRRLPAVHSPDKFLSSEAERQAINIVVQSFLGDYKALALAELVEESNHKITRICGEVHDSIIFWVKTEHLKKELPRIKSVMENPKKLQDFKVQMTIPLTVDIELGPWGMGKKWLN